MPAVSGNGRWIATSDAPRGVMSVELAAGQTLSAGHRNRQSPGASKMLDVVMLAIGLGFFALSVGYAYACDRL